MKINSLVVEIDGIDKEILRDLMEDARKPIFIANKIGISGAAIPALTQTRTIRRDIWF
jgi:Lrp/AsnC family transcriptional regulator for asnA, asnC and gidA